MSVVDLTTRARRTMVPAANAMDTWTMTLLERESPLAALGEYATAAQRGEGQVVLVVGEAGVGKSALVEQFERDRADANWSWGACDGLFTPRPLAPLFDIAEQLGGELLELCRAGAERDELFRAMLRQLADSPKLNVVVFEDIHWADEATLDLLRFLARRARTAPVMLIATYRDEGLDATGPLRRVLGQLVTQGLSSRIELEPLSFDAVQTLTEPSDLRADELYRLTAGNPFYVTEVLRGGSGDVPPNTRDVILARAAHLSTESRDALESAALIGARIEPALLNSVTAAPAAVVDELIASGLLGDDGARLRFRHEIARLAIEQAAPAHRRGAIHARILSALRDSDCTDDARLAFHAEGASDGPAVLKHAPLAARRAAELASHSEAVAQYQRTLRFATGLDSAVVAELYDRLVDELSLVDRWQDAADAGERALGLWRAVGDRLREGNALRQRSRTMWRLCRGRESREDAEAAVAILEPLGPSIELARAYSNLASDRMASSENDAAVEFARAAQAIAHPLGAYDVMSDALNTEACSVFSLGGDWLTPLEQALEMAITHRHGRQAGRAFANLQELHIGQLDFVRAETYYERGIAYTDDREMGTYATCLRGSHAGVLVQTGKWDEAQVLARQLLDACDPTSINRLNPLYCLGIIAARRGESGAGELLDQQVASADGTEEPMYIIFARVARCEAYWLEGNVDLARREIELADDVSADADPWERGSIAVWLRRTGSTRTPRGELAEPHRSQVAGDWQGAAQGWSEVGCPYDAALALLDSDEEAPLREALNAFDDLGAAAAARITRRRMRAIGVRSIPMGSRASTRAHPFGLTQREREVLDLVCDGYTNAEIAAELVISPRTVDHHVSAILTKLGAPTRNAAATQAARLGLVAVS